MNESFISSTIRRGRIFCCGCSGVDIGIVLVQGQYTATSRTGGGLLVPRKRRMVPRKSATSPFSSPPPQTDILAPFGVSHHTRTRARRRPQVLAMPSPLLLPQNDAHPGVLPGP